MLKRGSESGKVISFGSNMYGQVRIVAYFYY